MSESNIPTNQWKLWEVFTQKKSGLPHSTLWVNDTFESSNLIEHIPNYHKLLANPIYISLPSEMLLTRNEAVSIWVVPSECMVSSTPEDVGSFFDPANDKLYRHPNFYKTPDGVKWTS